ncbi:DUF3347 domain-containing protein [Arachidicoccus terrestris]|uniref:DUF3347 domain-containing protein n=1 Tax=Arachidicoccus terrestris TaxID=2875539 RepID=UPI001CC5866C|nr:DUF3347 domain-containing protein [Arachidicoccus terrestris]UAY56059.1 DUF3347 domain-containing protein [Arachidicoccus terrestris]
MMKKIFFTIALLSTAFLAVATGATVNQSTTYIHTTLHIVNGTADAGPVIKAYLSVKDALASDNAAAAAQSGNALLAALGQLEKEATAAKAKEAFDKDGQAALKSAQAIGKSGDIKAQRKAFKDLSEHLYSLIKVVGTSETLYLDYCPMAKASWLSDKKPIVNPYYGSSMLTCGSVKETIEP